MAAKIGTVRGYGAPPWTVLATRIPRTLHRAVKLRCVERDTPMMVFVVDALHGDGEVAFWPSPLRRWPPRWGRLAVQWRSRRGL